MKERTTQETLALLDKIIAVVMMVTVVVMVTAIVLFLFGVAELQMIIAICGLELTAGAYWFAQRVIKDKEQ